MQENRSEWFCCSAYVIRVRNRVSNSSSDRPPIYFYCVRILSAWDVVHSIFTFLSVCSEWRAERFYSSTWTSTFSPSKSSVQNMPALIMHRKRWKSQWNEQLSCRYINKFSTFHGLPPLCFIFLPLQLSHCHFSSRISAASFFLQLSYPFICKHQNVLNIYKKKVLVEIWLS